MNLIKIILYVNMDPLRVFINNQLKKKEKIESWIRTGKEERLVRVKVQTISMNRV